MSLAPGVRLGPYEILTPLGAGGMGEVYRARDIRLKREVAIKVLPEAFSQDPDRLARFQREAEVLATLNHPNIAAVYGFEETPSASGIVLELVEGPTLADRIAGGPVPLDEALAIAKQIAEALEAAHEKGVIHRDLKPANIKVTPDGKVKVLDFGLAKMLESERTASSLSMSPTLSIQATHAGVILGTAAYMSPEQARGKSVDKRADIWAFGVVVYEMLTGRALFAGDTITDVLAAVVTRDPDWTRIPAKVKRLLESCLEKDPSRRLRDIADAWRLLDDAPERSASSRSPLGLVAAAVAAVAVMTLAGLAFVRFREPPPARDVVRLQIPLPVGAQPDLNFTLSPDGRRLAFVGAGADGIRVWLRALDEFESRPLPGADNVDSGSLFWSPDSRWLAIAAGGKLKKIDVSGGAPQTIADVSGAGVIGGAWNEDGVIVFGSNAGGRPGGGGVFRVSAAGGALTPLTNVAASRKEYGHRFPTFLPDGRHFLYLRASSTQPENSGIFVGSVDAAPAQQPSTPLIAATSGPALYVPAADGGSTSTKGQLLFLREKTLMAQSFDAKSLTLSGEAVPVVEPVGSFLDRGLFTGSVNGTLVYTTASNTLERQLTWFDLQGKVIGTVGEPGPYTSVKLSPDGTRAAMVRNEYGTGLSRDIWLFDFTRGTQTRFTFGPGRSRNPVWSPDGTRIVFASDLGDGSIVYQKLASGAKDAEVLLKSDEILTPTSWSRDGRFLLYTVSHPQTRRDVWVIPMEGERKPFPFMQTPLSERDAQFSPDGRWVAYVSEEPGRNDVYVRPFSPLSVAGQLVADGKWLISTDGGESPRWLADGKLTYVRARREANQGSVMVVEVFSGPTFQSGPPRALINTNVRAVFGDSTADGKRLLGGIPTEESTAPPPFNVVLNWQAGLKP